MPQIFVEAGPKGLVGTRGLAATLAACPPGAPVIIGIHGYKYAPGQPGRCPHRLLFAPRSDRTSWKSLSWPRHLGFGLGRGPARHDEGLFIGFGWQATGSIWEAHAAAQEAGRALAALIWKIGRPVQLIGHSLGARVALAGLADAPPASVERLVLLAGAEHAAIARAAMDSPAGRGARVLNVTSGENLVFDLMFSAFVGPRGPALGAGLPGQRGWTDLAVDRPEARAHLARLGYRVPAPQRRVCHWSLYLRPGLMPIYRDVLRGRIDPARLALPAPGPVQAMHIHRAPAPLALGAH